MRTRRVNLPALVVAFLAIGNSASIARPTSADDAKLDGTWKLLVLAFGDDEFAILKLSTQDGKTKGSLVDAQQQLLGRPEVKGAVQKGDELKITLNGPTGETAFEGNVVHEGPSAGKILGSYNFRGDTYPARLEKTTETKVGTLGQSAMTQKYIAAMSENDPKAKVKKLEEAIQGNHGAPNNQLLYGAILDAAEAAGLDAAKVAETIKKWGEEAKPYGEAWCSEVRLKALRAIGARKPFAKLSVELAKDVDKTIDEKTVEKKAAVVAILAKAARMAGMEEVAKDADARSAKLDLLLDEEYHHKVPPFKPTPYSGRKNSHADRAVLMELFTGAQCPPCVAADVGFDALLQTYKPADFIGLQYHLHIPGPDPLTNRDSLERQKYYGSEIRGTPSTFFNGKSEAGGGGPMGGSQGKYNEFRAIIDKALETPKEAQIELSATRTGDEIKIVASAQAPEQSAGPNSDGAKPKDAKPADAKQSLRLALTEEAIRYVGGNRLRFHHHVVRALPGGAKGKELKGGTAKVEVALKLTDLKHDLEAYLSDFAKSNGFPNPLPEIKFENLAVVAFVQDDTDKNILHAVSVQVK